jgi:hypothetical protein
LSTPPDYQTDLGRLTAVERARAAGVPWTDLIRAHPAAPTNPQQMHQARGFVQFREGLGKDEDKQTKERAARILRARRDAPLGEMVWGLPDDPEDPAAADFSDVTRSLDDWAAAIHRRAVSGRHVIPRRLALPPAP